MKKIVLLFASLTSLCSCSLKTNIESEFVFNTNFILREESVNGSTQVDSWFVHENKGSHIFFDLDNNAKLSLIYLDGTEKDINFTYYLPHIGEPGESIGFLKNEDGQIDLAFTDNYFMIFDLPNYLNPEGENDIHTLKFQLWGER